MEKLFLRFIKIPAVFFFMFCLICPAVTMAQAEEEPEPEPEVFRENFRIQKLDTRSLSLGDATVADVFGRGGIGVNPALFGLFENKTALQFSASQSWNSSQYQGYFTLPTLSSGGHNFTGRIGTVNYGLESFNPTVGPILPEPNVEIYHADIAYSYAINGVFSAGVLQSVSLIGNDAAQFITYSADLGIVYVPDGVVTYGMVFRGLGHEVSYQFSEVGETLLDMNLMQQSLELGATLHYPVQNRHFLSVSFANEKRFGEEGIWYKAGLEILPTPAVSLRSGLIFHLDQSVFIPRFGLGLNTGLLNLHYAVSPRNLQGEYFHQLGLTIQF